MSNTLPLDRCVCEQPVHSGILTSHNGFYIYTSTSQQTNILYTYIVQSDLHLTLSQAHSQPHLFYGGGEGKGTLGQRINLVAACITMQYAYCKIRAVKWCLLDFLGGKNKLWGEVTASQPTRMAMCLRSVKHPPLKQTAMLYNLSHITLITVILLKIQTDAISKQLSMLTL